MKAVTRRDFLGMSAVGVAATTMAAPLVRAPRAQAASARALAGDVAAGSTAPVRPFPLSVVRLGDGLFQEKRDRMKNFISQFDDRRFLVLFNNNVGLPNPPGVPVVEQPVGVPCWVTAKRSVPLPVRPSALVTRTS